MRVARREGGSRKKLQPSSRLFDQLICHAMLLIIDFT
ncbi:hypothetical protein ALC53_07407 [Atta colombica]|uniref:Uncharacterized protein n=1 Tax=Atta colombica TaxID=520822 RepID=A0A195BD84_9HYME|nr:hypothetical protein ALC53_07407 [Atta colombica]